MMYRGEISKGDEIVIATENGPQVTRVRGLFRPRGMAEMRDAGDRWDAIETVEAASGLKLAAPDLDGVLAGTTLRVLSNVEEERNEAIIASKEESEISIELDEEGVIIKADTLGGLEALAFELRNLESPIPDLIEVATLGVFAKPFASRPSLQLPFAERPRGALSEPRRLVGLAGEEGDDIPVDVYLPRRRR